MNAAQKASQRRAERRANGLCGCGNIPPSGLLTCDECRARVKAAKAGRVSDGRCRCGRIPLSGYKLCEPCRESSKRRSTQFRRSQLDRGLCTCGQPVVDNKTRCAACLQSGYESTKKSLKNRRRWTLRGYLGRLFRYHKKFSAYPTSLTIIDICRLWEHQAGLCALSHLQMSHQPGNLKSASIDRKDSTTAYTVDNVQLVCRWVNFAKNKHSDDEFIAVLDEVRTQRIDHVI